MGRRRDLVAALVGDLSLTRPLAFAAVLNALVEAAGEASDAEWRRRWAQLTDEANPAGSRDAPEPDDV